MSPSNNTLKYLEHLNPSFQPGCSRSPPSQLPTGSFRVMSEESQFNLLSPAANVAFKWFLQNNLFRIIWPKRMTFIRMASSVNVLAMTSDFWDQCGRPLALSLPRGPLSALHELASMSSPAQPLFISVLLSLYVPAFFSY